MLYLYDDEQQALMALGKRLTEQRLSRNETQAVFAGRVGVSRVTYGKMEHGDPSVAVGHWIRSLGVLNKLNQCSFSITPGEATSYSLSPCGRGSG